MCPVVVGMWKKKDILSNCGFVKLLSHYLEEFGSISDTVYTHKNSEIHSLFNPEAGTLSLFYLSKMNLEKDTW